MQTLPDAPPACPQHGPMAPRPPDRQSAEQLWCGTWHDCRHTRCLNASLLPSTELRALHEQAATQALTAGHSSPRGQAPAGRRARRAARWGRR